MLERFKKEIGENEVILWHGAYSSLFILFDWVNQKYYTGWHRTPASPAYFVIKGRDTRLAFCNTYYEGYARDIFTDYINKEKSFKLLEKTYSTASKAIEKKYYKLLSKKMNQLSDEDLRTELAEMYDLFSGDLESKSIYIETFSYDIALEVLGKEHKTMLDSLWENATHPAFESFEMRRLRLILEMFDGDVDWLARKVQFMYTDYFEPLSWQEITKALESIVGSEESLALNRQKVRDYAIELKKRQKEFKSWFKTLDKESQFITKYIQLIMELRDIRKDPLAMGQAVISNIVKELLRRSGVDESLSPFINGREVINGGRQWIEEHKEEIELRPEGYKGYMATDGSFGSELCNADLEARLLDEYAVQTMEIEEGVVKGQIASPGIVTGTVRVIPDMSLLKEFNEGDILVTGMTRPEFVPLMKKAGGIVTDEGGITSHAAIVSRELKKPCIIGTKNATKVLKDGDQVEVNADEGIVTIIN